MLKKEDKRRKYNTKSVGLTIRISQNDYKEIKELAELQKKSISMYGGELVNEALKSYPSIKEITKIVKQMKEAFEIVKKAEQDTEK